MSTITSRDHLPAAPLEYAVSTTACQFSMQAQCISTSCHQVGPKFQSRPRHIVHLNRMLINTSRLCSKKQNAETDRWLRVQRYGPRMTIAGIVESHMTVWCCMYDSRLRWKAFLGQYNVSNARQMKSLCRGARLICSNSCTVKNLSHLATTFHTSI